MRGTVLLLISIAAIGCTGRVPQAAQTRVDPTTLPAEQDPRLGLISYFDALRKGDEAAAFACWLDDVSDNPEQREYIIGLVHHRVAEMIADARLQQALSRKTPAVYTQLRRSGGQPPEPAEIAAAQFAIYRRLAVIKWGNEEDDGFPMVLDNSDQARKVWKISMQQWHETTRSSVGDSLLLSGWSAQATDLTTKDVVDGKVQTVEGLSETFMRHLSELAKAEELKEQSPSSQPGAR